MTFDPEVRPASLCLALVHNNDAARNALIRPALSELGERLGLSRQVTSLEVSWQPALAPSSTAIAFARDAICKLVERPWLQYRLSKPRSALVSARKVTTLAINYLTNKRGVRETRRRCGAIEEIVTDKHIRAWDRFIESRSEILVVFEDDAVLSSDSCERILPALEAAAQASGPLYADLAGGLPRSVLNAAALEERVEGALIYYKKPLTNTACVYLMNRQMVEECRAIVFRSPWLRLVSIDLMMNQLFVELEKQGIRSRCFHAVPAIFNHGSFTGEFQAWQR